MVKLVNAFCLMICTDNNGLIVISSTLFFQESYLNSSVAFPVFINLSFSLHFILFFFFCLDWILSLFQFSLFNSNI